MSCFGTEGLSFGATARASYFVKCDVGGDGTASGRQQGMAAGGLCRGAVGLRGGLGRAGIAGAAGLVLCQSDGLPFATGPAAEKEIGGDAKIKRHGQPEQVDGV